MLDGPARWTATAGPIAGGGPIALFEATLTARRPVLGEDHPDTLTSANNLANAYRRAGRHAEAIPIFEATLAACRRVLGDDHATTKILERSYESARGSR